MNIKYSETFIRERLQKKVAELKDEGILNDKTIYLVMLSGGVWFASHVFDCIPDMTNEVYFLKGHSYSGKTQGKIEWDYMPNMNLKGRQVVVIDDICDTGNTIHTIYETFKNEVESICFFTLLKRSTCQLDSQIQLYSCITDESDDFFAGCGLDDNNQMRMLPYVVVV